MHTREELYSNHLKVTHSVKPAQNGIRLDAFLKTYYRRRSREKLKAAIEEGHVQIIREQSPHLHTGKIKPSSQLVAGDEVLVLTERRPEPPVDFGYKVLFEDEHLYIINKPPHLPVHPAGKYFFNTLMVHLRTDGFRNPLKADREFYLPHRIDKETSGVLVLAKGKEVCTSLIQQFSGRTTEKKYLAIVWGRPTRTKWSIDLALARKIDSAVRVKMHAVPDGYSAHTDFELLKTFQRREGTFSLLACYPKTGRQHQIRAHLALSDYPIVGDKLYGVDDETALRFFAVVRNITPELEHRLVLPRHALHASSIRITHPITSQRLEFVADLPPDLESFLGSETDRRALHENLPASSETAPSSLL